MGVNILLQANAGQGILHWRKKKIREFCIIAGYHQTGMIMAGARGSFWRMTSKSTHTRCVLQTKKKTSLSPSLDLRYINGFKPRQRSRSLQRWHMGYVMPFSKPLAKHNSTVLFVLIFNYLLSAAIWSNFMRNAHVSGFRICSSSNEPCPSTFFKNLKGFLCQSKLSFFRQTRLHWNSSRIFAGEKPMEAELLISMCDSYSKKFKGFRC